MKLALVTGASSGIGAATAELLAAKGASLILIARREERLLQVKRQLESAHGISVTVVPFDIRHPIPAIPGIEKVDLLVNNAGLARGTAKIQDGDPKDWEDMISTNVSALLRLTRVVLPHMIKNGRGHVVNIGSVAGRWVYPGGAVYCASKFAVRAISEGLRMDLSGTPIRVTNIEPGMVNTEFSEVRLQDKDRAKAVYQGMQPLSAKDIAECIVWSALRPAHVNIQEMVIYPTAQASVQLVHRG